MKTTQRLLRCLSVCAIAAALLGGGCVGPDEDVARDAVIYPLAVAGVVGEAILQGQVYDSYGKTRYPPEDSSRFPAGVFPPVPESEFQSGLTPALFPPPSSEWRDWPGDQPVPK